MRNRYSRRTRRDCRHRVPVGNRVLAADPGGGDRVSDTVNVDTLVERLRTHITTDGLVVPSDEALATLDDLAARARLADTYREDRDEYDALLGRKMEERDRLARRVAELEAALRRVDEWFREQQYIVDLIRDALAGDGGGA